MRIGELARRTGVSHRLLRYYEEQGLLQVQRSANGYREYGEDTVGQVRRIRALLAAGLSTQVIRDVLPCARGEAPELDMCPELAATLHRELSGMDARIAALTEARTALASFVSAVPAGR
ncbi:MerR family transcriptional regulator [Marinitenerispora sediminis]|uniref:MerR family transcriptional regulator n=1 Tax=Marinitenerispora sediminis TaxID=1931232 RepID=A0A368T1A7_9ACTN|nr:MerR family transcriptional regulator [Marinitenerispora sediminis]RCV51816.1 MerR family transcriptional regulator [Marinitenerispora sediminis]RCV53869.1 MerR family transcriptional regulator [Marinitenerispora sediminis]RCV54165.1 MerR family transcriptional regulator [Marinitenerispora sediminis]